MERIRKAVNITILVLLAGTGAAFLLGKGCVTLVNRQYADAVPPTHMQSFDDFVAWQTHVEACRQVQIRGVTYYHVIGPPARPVPSGGALYVFDAKGNYVGWSLDSGDVMRNEAIFYPKWWLPAQYTVEDITFAELKKRISNSVLKKQVEMQGSQEGSQQAPDPTP